jgi:hypothetical protein
MQPQYGDSPPVLTLEYELAESMRRAQAQAAERSAKASIQPPHQTLIDPRKAQLLALFDLSDKRGQDLLIAIAVIHADRYPKVPK